MREFLKDMMDWVLDKEETFANNCAIPPEQIEKQIDVMQRRKEKYEAECNSNLQEMKHIIVRLEKMLDKAKACRE